MSQKPINAESTLEDQLVAYLDGELDSESCRHIEELLAADPEVRRKLHWLEQTWEMLDELENTPVDDNFTRSTLEMVAVAAEEEVRKIREDAPRRRRRWLLLVMGGLLAAGLAGFMAVTLAAPNPNKELLQDLPILENLEEYRQIKDMAFLRMLKDRELFPKEEGDTSSRPPLPQDDEGKLQYINSLSPNLKVELRRKHKSFTGLGKDERNRLTQLHEQIQQDEDRDELLGIMERYSEWCKTSLSAYSRDTLDLLSPEKRLEWVINRRQEEQTKTDRPPTAKDANAIWHWMEDYAEKHRKKFEDGLPPPLREKFPSMSPSAQRNIVMWMIWQRPQSGSNRPPDADMEELRSQLTPETQKLLETKPQSQQYRMMQDWTHNLLRQKPGFGVGELVSDQLLAEFFANELTDKQRDRIVNLSGEEMQRALLRLYIQKKSPELFPRQPDGPPPGPPPETRDKG